MAEASKVAKTSVAAVATATTPIQPSDGKAIHVENHRKVAPGFHVLICSCIPLFLLFLPGILAAYFQLTGTNIDHGIVYGNQNSGYSHAIFVPSNETLRENDIASLLSREGERFGGLEDPVEPNLLAFEQVLNPQHASTKEVTGHNMSTLTKMTSSQIPQRRVKEHSSEVISQQQKQQTNIASVTAATAAYVPSQFPALTAAQAAVSRFVKSIQNIFTIAWKPFGFVFGIAIRRK